LGTCAGGGCPLGRGSRLGGMNEFLFSRR
jgi:hypothetical protein